MVGPAPRPVVWRDLSHQQLDYPQLSSERLAIPMPFQQFGGTSPKPNRRMYKCDEIERCGCSAQGYFRGLIAFLPLVASNALIHWICRFIRCCASARLVMPRPEARLLSVHLLPAGP